MDDFTNSGCRTPAFTYDRHGVLLASEELTEEQAREAARQLAAAEAAEPPPCRFEHDPAARALRITAADGTVETFRDIPTRYLRVERDPETGELRPVMKRGRPVYLSLCRDDREAR